MDRRCPEAAGEAEDQFRGGLYCAESVLKALAKLQGVESELLPKIATGFCGGMAGTSGPCGAITGAIMGIGLAFGRDRSGDIVEPCYGATQRLIGLFEAEFGARNCTDLIGCDLGTEEGQMLFRKNNLHERCLRYVGRSTELAAQLIEARLSEPSIPNEWDAKS